LGNSWKGKLPEETLGQIQGAGFLEQREVVIAEPDVCVKELLQEIESSGKADRRLKLLTIETESSLGT
jgi:hypothetical protein